MEERLPGGNTHGRVVRVGNTVRRPAGPWTPGVHKVLSHLDARGFSGAPRPLGVDGEGREILSFIAGRVVDPDHLELIGSDEALALVAGTIRSFHDAVADFPAPGDYAWWDRGLDPRGPGEILCHNDLAPWNLVARNDGSWAFVDWDLVAPGRRAWDLAWAVLTFVPLLPGRLHTDSDIRRRLGAFRAGYGAPAWPDGVLDVAIERCKTESGRIRSGAERGEHPFVRLRDEGHDHIWAAAAAHVARNVHAWAPALA